MAVRPLTIVVRGAGSIGSRYVRILSNLDKVHRVLAWPVGPEHHAGLIAGNVEVIAGSDSIPDTAMEAWIIATDTGRHVDDALAAIDRGAAVLIEKPVAAEVASAAPLLGLARDNAMYVSAPLRFQGALNQFRAALPRIGVVHSVRIECQTYLPDWRPGSDFRRGYAARADEGGVLRDLIHEIDYACWLFGRPDAVCARLDSTGRLGLASEEAADIWWRLPGGGSVSIRLDYLTRPARRKMVAAGSNGTLEWDGLGQRVHLSLADGSVESVHLPEDTDAPLSRQVEAFLGAVHGESDVLLATLEDGLAALAVCDAARRSSGVATDVAVEAP